MSDSCPRLCSRLAPTSRRSLLTTQASCCACLQVRNLLDIQFGKTKRGHARPWYVLDGRSRKMLETLGKCIAVTADFGRPYWCASVLLL